MQSAVVRERRFEPDIEAFDEFTDTAQFIYAHLMADV